MKVNKKFISELTLQDHILELKQDPEFAFHFEREKLIHDISAAIHKAREASNLSQQQLAELASTRQPVIARLEKGSSNVNPTLDLLFRLSKAIGKKLVISFQ